MTDIAADGLPAASAPSDGDPSETRRAPVSGEVRVRVQAWAAWLAVAWVRVGAPALRAAARQLRVVTALGWGMLAAAAGAAILARLFDWAELAAVAVAAAGTVVVALPFLLGRVRLRVRVELASPRVTVGEPAVGRVVVHNAAARTMPSVHLELPVGAARARFRLPRLAADAEHDELFTIPTQHRAVLRLGPVRSVRTDPVGVLRRSVRWTEPTELYVHPRVVRLDADTTGLIRDLEGLPTRILADDDVSFHALRDYVPGDDLRHVHWKATARSQTLMIRQFEQTRRSHTVIVLSTRTEDYADADEFELAVSVAGSIGRSALHNGRAVTLVDTLHPRRTTTATRMLDHLSGVDLTDDAPRLAALGQAVATTTSAASVVVFVAGAPVRAGALRRAALRVPVAARAVCVQAAQAAAPSRRTLGDIALLTVPTLDDLPRAMRSAA